MMDFKLTLSTAPEERLAASTAMLDRVTGVERRLLVVGIPLPFALVGALGIAWVMAYPLVEAAIVALYTVLMGLIGMIIAARLQARRVGALFSASTLMRLAQPVRLSETGVGLEARHLPWSAITGQSRWKQTTLLHFSAVDALVIPDRDLPVGMTAEALQAQVAKWRQQ